MTRQVSVGSIILYAAPAYEVVRVNAGLLTLVGLADPQTRTCREPATVLAEDVTLLAEQPALRLEED